MPRQTHQVHCLLAPVLLLLLLQNPFIDIVVMCDEGLIDPLDRQVAA